MWLLLLLLRPLLLLLLRLLPLLLGLLPSPLPLPLLLLLLPFCRNCWLLLSLLLPLLLHAKAGPWPACAAGRAACEARDGILLRPGRAAGGQGACVACVL